MTLQGALQSDWHSRPVSAQDKPKWAERVLVLPRHRVPGGTGFPRRPPGRRRGSDPPAQSLTRHGRYLERAVAEEDPSHKQLIPYVVVRDAERVFLMHRTDAGGDPRLHGKASIGVGGHLNPVDEGEDALMAGFLREWAEELEADWEPAFQLIGLLNDDSNPVGAVHLGVVFEVQADGRPSTCASMTSWSAASSVPMSWPQLAASRDLVAAGRGRLGSLRPGRPAGIRDRRPILRPMVRRVLAALSLALGIVAPGGSGRGRRRARWRGSS